MNELLIITQTQPMPTQNVPNSTTNTTESNRDDSFEKLVNSAIKKQTEKNPIKVPVDDDAPIQQESVQGMVVVPNIVSEFIVPLQQRDVESVFMPEIAPIETSLEQQVVLHQNTEPVIDAEVSMHFGLEKVEAVVMSARPIEIEAGMAAETEGMSKTPVNGVVEISEPEVDVKNDLSKRPMLMQMQDSVVKDEVDEGEKAVLLSDISVQSLNSEKQIVKVGENYNVENPDFVENLTESITVNVNGETTEFELSLYPKELGKIKVNVVFESGRAVISLVCENQKAQQILNSHIEEIRSLVETNAKQPAEVNVQQDTDENYQRDNNDGRGQNRENQQQESRKPKEEEVRFFIDQLKINMLTSA